MKSKLTLSTLMACLIVGNAGFAAVTEVDGTTETLGAGNYQGIKVTNNGVVNIDATNGEVAFDGKEIETNLYYKIDGEKKYITTGLYVDKGNVSINADKLIFNSLEQVDTNDYAGLLKYNGYFVGDTTTNINANELYIGSSEKDVDNGFQFRGPNNQLNINTDKFIAYVGGTLINAQGDESGTSVVNFGTANDRIGYFEAHATWDEGETSLAILQTNEGNTINLYADTAILDGSHDKIGGVIGSGGYGTVNVVASDLTIDGNICGTYGGRKDTGEKLALNVTADNLNMIGDINIGSLETTGSSFNRDTEINITVTENANITGDINVYGNDVDDADDDSILNVDFKNNAVLTGKINVDGKLGTVNLGGNADMTSSSGIYKVTNGGNVNFTGGTWAVNEWSGDNGNINVGENATLNINNTIKVADAVINGDVVLDTDKVTGAAITATNSATLNENANVILTNVEAGETITTSLFGGTAGTDAINKQAISQMKTDNLMHLNEKLKQYEGFISGVTTSAVSIFTLAVLIASIIITKDVKNNFVNILIPTIAMASSFGPVIALSNLSNNLFMTLASGERVLNLLAEKPIIEEVYNGKEDLEFNGLECQNVSFDYEGEEILNDYNLKIEPNKIIGISGKSGSGKSTLLKLFMRFWDIKEGSLKISDTNIKDINTNKLRDIESYVTQETSIFKDTIENNIKIANSNATREEVIEACKKASLHDFVMTLPNGYDTNVGELGDTLSGGEKQRIGIARSFLHKAPFILLDEPTSNLDSLNEAVILKSIKENTANQTVVLVSHRLSTLNIADKVYQMKADRVS